jgi:hypothetical protein
MKKVILILLIISFSNAIGQTSEPYVVFKKKNIKIEIIISGTEKFIYNNKTNHITVRTENLDTKEISFGGPGLALLEYNPNTINEAYLEVNLKEFKGSKAYFMLIFKTKNGQSVTKSFEIPVK